MTPVYQSSCQALEQAPPIRPANQRIDEIFRMRHQAQHIEAFGINPGDVIDRAVRIGAAVPAVTIAEGDPALALESELASLDAEIARQETVPNALVYALHGLSAEEIEMAEKG